MITNIEEGDVVLCTVDRIIGTNVFVKIEDNGEGCIVFSEVAPGRIRNIRDYAVPKKKIVCKVLRISGDRIDLSLRRVTQKEQKEVREIYKQEKSYEKILKSVLGEEQGKKIIKEISKKNKIYDFLQNAKENPKELEKLVGKENVKKIIDILKTQKQKKTILKKEIFLTTTEPNGIELIKNLLGMIKGTEVKYVSSGKYSLKKESEDIKKADHELTNTLIKLEKEAKRKKVEFGVIKK
jgi:translation initiation factor 2 alpha subunit (eIF-2alpha)